jgi:hypothetical protein
VSLLHTHTSHSAGSRPSLMSTRQGCATGSVLFCGCLRWAGDRPCRVRVKGRVSVVVIATAVCPLRDPEKGERGRRERGPRAGPESQRCYEVVRVHRLQLCRVLLLGPIAGRVLILVLVLVGVVLLAEVLSGRWQIINCLSFAWGVWVAEVGKMMREGGGWWEARAGEGRRGQIWSIKACAMPQVKPGRNSRQPASQSHRTCARLG